tara:strand:- start:495 stop:1181 length:687 start_codon:yes stop_codon:yes gene_type:complete
MATGFAQIQRNTIKSTTGYKTLFEKITERTKGEKKSLSWYRSAVKSEASSYNKNFKKYILNEQSDKVGAAADQDANELRRYTVQGHLYMFEYKAKMKWLKYYDRFPLVYVLKATRGEFWGLNLHYLTPKKRIQATKKLMQGRIDIPKSCFHKYLQSHVDGLMIDLAITEWDTAILLPTEDFVKNAGQLSFPVSKEEVWQDTKDTFYDKIRGERLVKGYGTKQSKEMAI